MRKKKRDDVGYNRNLGDKRKRQIRARRAKIDLEKEKEKDVDPACMYFIGAALGLRHMIDLNFEILLKLSAVGTTGTMQD